MNTCEKEAKWIHSVASIKERPGRQHEKTPLHLRILLSVAFGLTDCWHWRRPVSRLGYGRITVQNKYIMAHRASYGAFVGPIPHGLSVLHRCDNRACVNPDHLFLGTYADNRQDCISKGRWRLRNKRRGFSHQSNSVTPEVLAAIRQLRIEGVSYQKIAQRVGLSTMTIWHAINTRFKEV